MDRLARSVIDLAQIVAQLKPTRGLWALYPVGPILTRELACWIGVLMDSGFPARGQDDELGVFDSRSGWFGLGECRHQAVKFEAPTNSQVNAPSTDFADPWPVR